MERLAAEGNLVSTAFGSRWIPCVTKISWRASGSRVGRRGGPRDIEAYETGMWPLFVN
jgi:hypothetical protein